MRQRRLKVFGIVEDIKNGVWDPQYSRGIHIRYKDFVYRKIIIEYLFNHPHRDIKIIEIKEIEISRRIKKPKAFSFRFKGFCYYIHTAS